jgi:2-polyprenyl-3-methyl-5-hydroxy-6-metoxy-1,4-benzoquinol methylase
VLDDGVKGPKVLDVGCGTGDLAIALARRGYEVSAIDISRVAIDMARAKAETVLVQPGPHSACASSQAVCRRVVGAISSSMRQR